MTMRPVPLHRACAIPPCRRWRDGRCGIVEDGVVEAEYGMPLAEIARLCEGDFTGREHHTDIPADSPPCTSCDDWRMRPVAVVGAPREWVCWQPDARPCGYAAGAEMRYGDYRGCPYHTAVAAAAAAAAASQMELF